MVYDQDKKRMRRRHVLRFFAALALPALLLGSAIAAVEWAAPDPPARADAQKAAARQ
ncbi:hypothetical protein CN151_25505 [Sinorhizobium meliloti]|jgi:hypothetical protein|uniref:Uncharacterized protein n=4 Tax=Sinorhizobium TaxID=28105 RepID=H0FZQ5_RHIML|nr:hypothetical protein [Sinorhizobium meliloti]AEG08070.1 exported peptide protein [Sinorhizobium meliloti BL225C]AEG56464.1 exported peptide protein [Sinorhizobium meliloti AK83]AEH83524.1 hypothetical exported peptide protein [Sinorhizobium meliloti SM11]AGA10791.1 hypothetical protein C770_GR4pD0675 [Sinorhizobium meliloti GR4]ARS68512.1 hypothetical protein SMRU11_15345 [Sinorhizobium meliloti RU11/001]EHK77429.1 hypothetical protein SM0020_13447 [Sinorhizobium meliloti CCNWSX0020]PII38